MFRLPLEFPNARFAHKDEIKPYLATTLAPSKIVVAIERSDNTKIVFRCRLGPGQCPFRIRANHLLKSGLWTLLVVCDLHNHKVDNAQIVPIDLVPLLGSGAAHPVLKGNKQVPFLPHLGVFVGMIKPTQPAPEKYVEQLMRKMSSEVAQLMSEHVWNNNELLTEQKEVVVARFVAETVDEYLGTEPEPRAHQLNSTMPLSPLLNDTDVSTQLPALAGSIRLPGGPLPPFNALQNNLLQQEFLDAKTLNPVQLLKTAPHDLSEFKVALGEREVLLGNLHLGYSGWSTVAGLNE